MRINGIRASIYRDQSRDGWGIMLTKSMNGKSYKPVMTLEWVECQDYEYREALLVDEINNHDSPNKESRIYGEATAQKNEIDFLRSELSKALSR